MRLGRLDKRAAILSLAADLSPVTIGSRWVGIRAKEAADAGQASGLRTGAMVEVRARGSAELSQGRYLLSGSRLLHITSARDPMGTGAELVLSCDELVGQPGEYRPDGQPPKACRVHLTHSAPYLDELGQVGQDELRAIDAALERIAKGTFGTCVKCGSEISEDRLKAVPYTPFCQECAAAL